MLHNSLRNKEIFFAIAPMMDWTDCHCRYFHRGLTRSALLYTEMVTADAVIHGDRARLLGFSEDEHRLALQLGGSDPQKLAEAARIGADFGYDEINLNVGCPSDRVQSGTFGACLMLQPQRVAACIAAMKSAVSLPVTVKCRIGVDDQDPEAALDAFAGAVVTAGADAIWVHARKAWLTGLSPKDNRCVPPLDYDRVYRLKRRLPEEFVGINGGILSLDEAEAHLARTDGVMIGRAAYRNPEILAGIDRRFYDGTAGTADIVGAARRMIPYAEKICRQGGRVSAVTRHMIGLFQGRPGARRWRQILSVDSAKSGAGAEVIATALQAVEAAGGFAPNSAGQGSKAA
jgi:tRNA-dihydrouridine synthase A